MKIFLFLATMSLLLVFPFESTTQSSLPIFESKKSFQPPSGSRRPVGSRRPIAPSRRSRIYQQLGWDLGANVGTAYSLTDVSGLSIDQRPSFLNTQWNTLSMNLGAFARYKFHELFAVSGTFNYARVHGADSLAGRARNFSFDNNIIEVAVNYEVFVPNSSPRFPFSFYGFIGLAAFYHNPNLRVPNPPPADFTLDQYSNIQPAIPMGLGFNYSITQDMKIGYEIGWRKTFFDYLDGFTRPWSRGSDSYYFGSLKFSYFVPLVRRRW